jgi:hypothetical protein
VRVVEFFQETAYQVEGILLRMLIFNINIEILYSVFCLLIDPVTLFGEITDLALHLVRVPLSSETVSFNRFPTNLRKRSLI